MTCFDRFTERAQDATACAVKPEPAVARKFKEKYDWDITEDAYYTQVFEVIVKKQVMSGNNS